MSNTSYMLQPGMEDSLLYIRYVKRGPKNSDINMMKALIKKSARYAILTAKAVLIPCRCIRMADIMRPPREFFNTEIPQKLVYQNITTTATACIPTTQGTERLIPASSYEPMKTLVGT